MKRPHPVAGLFAVAVILWVASVALGVVAFLGFDVTADRLSVPTALAGAAAIGSTIFLLWATWRACRALDFLVANAR